jgi:hypothetical protein
MTLQLIGAGLGRTGTLSLSVALEQLLGGRCYHMTRVSDDTTHADVWASAYRGDLPNWEQLFDGYTATVDWPSAPFWPEIAAAFPEAPILLSTRDADSWWRSASNTIFPIMDKAYFAPGSEDNGWSQMAAGMMARFTPDWRNEASAKAAFVAYNDEVRRNAPADRLIEWQPSDGWGPLCEALGVPAPDDPFPHTNTTQDMRAILDTL